MPPSNKQSPPNIQQQTLSTHLPIPYPPANSRHKLSLRPARSPHLSTHRPTNPHASCWPTSVVLHTTRLAQSRSRSICSIRGPGPGCPRHAVGMYVHPREVCWRPTGRGKHRRESAAYFLCLFSFHFLCRDDGLSAVRGGMCSWRVEWWLVEWSACAAGWRLMCSWLVECIFIIIISETAAPRPLKYPTNTRTKTGWN